MGTCLNGSQQDTEQKAWGDTQCHVQRRNATGDARGCHTAWFCRES